MSTISTSGIAIHDANATRTSPSPARSPATLSASSSRHSRSNSAELQSQIESERAEVLSDVKEAHHDQFEKVDSLSHQLENTVHNAMDIFKRDLPPKVGGQEDFSGGRIIITSPTSATAAGSALGGATLVKESGDDQPLSSSSLYASSSSSFSPSSTPAVDFASTAPIVTETMYSTKTATSPATSVRKMSSPSPASRKASTPTVQVSEERQRSYSLRGVEKDTTIDRTSSPIPSTSNKDLQIASISLSLIQAKQAYMELMERLYASNIGSSLIGADTRTVTSPSLSVVLSSINSDDRSLSSFLQSLPVQKGWLRMKQRATANVPPSYARKYVALSFDGLMLSDDESGQGGVEKVDISRYWLIERAKDKMEPDTNYAASAASAGSAASAFTSPLSPVAGKSVFRLENGAYVVRLVPILTDAAHPQTVLEPSVSQVIEFTGDSESDIESPDTLNKWVDALNLRISLLALLKTPDHTNLLARGGREVVTLLCSLESRTLLIENKLVDVAAIFSYFKEPLIHRRHFSLSLRNVALDDAGVKVLTELLMLNHSIHHVDLSSNLITGVGASYLATSLEMNQSLSSLCLDFNPQLSEDGVLEIISALASSSALTGLSLRGCRINDALLSVVVDTLRAGVAKVWSLLDFSWNELTDASAESVGVLVSAFSVASLILSHNRYGDRLLSAIDSSLSSSSSSLAALALLDVSYNTLTGASAASLSSLLAACQSLSIKLSGNTISPSTLIALLSSPTTLSVEELRITRLNNGTGKPAPLKKRLSIMKEDVKGKVQLIDPLHPRSEKELGRELEEVSTESKTNSVMDGVGRDASPRHGPAMVGGEEKDVLDVPATAASTALLVDGGKTADPRSIVSSSPPGPTVDTRSTDPRTLEMEAEAAAESARARVYARAGLSRHGSRSSTSPGRRPPAMSASGLVPMTPQQMETEKQDSIVKGKYPQADLSTV